MSRQGQCQRVFIIPSSNRMAAFLPLLLYVQSSLLTSFVVKKVKTHRMVPEPSEDIPILWLCNTKLLFQITIKSAGMMLLLCFAIIYMY